MLRCSCFFFLSDCFGKYPYSEFHASTTFPKKKKKKVGTALCLLKLMGPIAVILRVECFSTLPCCRISVSLQFGVSCVIFYISNCTKHLQWVICQDYRQASWPLLLCSCIIEICSECLLDGAFTNVQVTHAIYTNASAYKRTSF